MQNSEGKGEKYFVALDEEKIPDPDRDIFLKGVDENTHKPLD